METISLLSQEKGHALHTFIEAFQGCHKNEVTGGWDFRTMSGVYMLICIVLIFINFHIVHQIDWLLLHAPMFLSLSH